jgi:acetyl-CoA hydrolase
MADKIIIEVNTKIPSFEGLHDLTFYKKATGKVPVGRKPNLITRVDDRIGMTAIPVDWEKIVAIVESHSPDNTTPTEQMDQCSEAISHHILEFLQHEVNQGVSQFYKTNNHRECQHVYHHFKAESEILLMQLLEVSQKVHSRT